MGEIRIKRDVSDAIVYGIHIDPNISDPSNAVTYLEDAVGMTPASMGSTTFNSGSWADAFFMPKPCMVRYDGTVDYYLDPSDYSKKADGTASDIADSNYAGNAMMEWGLIWYKFDTENLEEGEVNFYVSNKQVDDSYHCWCNYDFDGNIIPHFYTAIYNGTSAPIYSNESTYSVGDRVTYSYAEYECKTPITTAEEWDYNKWTKVSNVTRLRSLSGVQLTPENGNGNTTGTIEIDRSTANNVTYKNEWYTDILADRELINMLLVLIGKSLNCQAVFGRGLDTGGQAAKEAYVTGTLDDKGLFWGVTGNGNNAVKVFGMENYWGCVWHRVAGMVSVHDATTNSNTVKIKLTHSTVDGTTVNGFNSTGNGYIDTGVEVATDVGVYIRKMKYFDKGYTPLLTTGGSSTTYYSDYTYVNYVGTYYLLAGGNSGNGLNAGPFYFNLHNGFSRSYWDIAAVLSLKPRAKIPYNPDWDNRPVHQFINGQWVDIPTHHYTNGRWQGELTSQSPLEFKATGQSLLDWRIDGASGGVGDWDETAQKYRIPVTVNGENLFDGELEQGSLGTSAGQEYPTTTRVRLKKPGIDLQPGTYTIDCVGATGGVVVYVYNKDSSWDKEQSSKNWQSLPLTFSLSSERLVRFAFRKTGDSDILPSEITDIQLLEGTYTASTLPPYEVNLYTDHQLMDGDSIDYTTDQTTIPITQGDNILTVETAVQPSKVFVKFEG